MHRRSLLTLTFLLYSIVVALTVGGLFAARRAAIALYGNVAEQARWEEFQAEMDSRHLQREALRAQIARETGQPIIPKPPKSHSPRPPALELLSQHFAACVGVSLLAASGLFVVIWGMIVGAIMQPGRVVVASNDNDFTAASRPPDVRQLG